MLNEITSQLTSCADKLQRYYGHYQTNQGALRRQVVEPVLTVLGWDLDNPSDVHIDETLDGVKIEYLKYGNILDAEKADLRTGIQTIVRVIAPNEDVSNTQLVYQTQNLLVEKQIPACIITNGTDWHFIAVTKEKKRLNQVSTVQGATDWLIYFARPNITYVRIFLTLHMKTMAFQSANNLLWQLTHSKKFGRNDTNFWEMLDYIRDEFRMRIDYDFPYFNELTDINLFFNKHLATLIDKGTDASALRVIFTKGKHKGKVLFSETAKWVLVETIKTVGLRNVHHLNMNAYQGTALIGKERRHIYLVEDVAVPKVPQEEVVENGKSYFIAHSLNNEQKVNLLEQLNKWIDDDDFGVELWSL